MKGEDEVGKPGGAQRLADEVLADLQRQSPHEGGKKGIAYAQSHQKLEVNVTPSRYYLHPRRGYEELVKIEEDGAAKHGHEGENSRDIFKIAGFTHFLPWPPQAAI